MNYGYDGPLYDGSYAYDGRYAIRPSPMYIHSIRHIYTTDIYAYNGPIYILVPYEYIISMYHLYIYLYIYIYIYIIYIYIYIYI